VARTTDRVLRSKARTAAGRGWRWRLAVRLLAASTLASMLLLVGFSTALAGARVAGAASPDAGSTKSPKVTQQPVSVTVEEGATVVFEAAASGIPAPSVQWELSTNGGAHWSAVAQATSDVLTIADASTSESGHQYRAVFTNGAGTATSKAAVLTVQLAPTVTQQPASVAVEEGHSATFEAGASGSPTPTVQWEMSSDGGGTWAAVKRATADQLSIASAKTSEDGDQYRAVFTNAAGSATSAAATLTVHNPPKLTLQPVGVSVEEGHSASFEAAATGFPTPTVQWELSTNSGGSWSAVAGATANTLTIASAGGAENGDEYRAVFTNAAGSATSNTATLTVRDFPAVTEQPVATTVEVGQNAQFEATASGFPAPTVQWEVSTNGGGSWSPLAGATADTLAVEDVQVSQNGNQYRAVFTNTAGKAVSEAARLTVASHHYRVVAWGANTFGQLGDGNFAQSDIPVLTSGLNFVTAIAGGKNHSLALLSDASVVAWGSDTSGQLGDDEEVSSDVPEAVVGLAEVKAIAAGANQSMALLANGTVMAWGGNESGQLGDGSTSDSEDPVAVKGLSGVMAIAAGGEHGLALLSNGTVMAWGENEYGQLGDGATRNSDLPVPVKGLTGVTAIAAGEQFSLALLSDGQVMAWGADQLGELGELVPGRGPEEERFSEVPVAVEGVSGASAIAAGGRHSLALLTGGTVMAWGADGDGQLGDGAIESSSEGPVPVSGLAEATQIAAGGDHSMALLHGGTVATWGEGKRGELGNGSSSGEPSDVPVQVTGLGEVVGIAAGGMHDLATTEPVPTVSGVSPASGPATGGTKVTITGSTFAGATSVHFGSSAATSFTVESPETISAVAPAGAPGTVDVTVTTAAGTSPTGTADRFSYAAPPTVAKLSVTDGAAAGGTSVVITGTNLNGATSVDFGATAATAVTVESATQITAVAPAGSGTVDVTVTTPGGISALSKHDRFGYTPSVAGITPGGGAAAGGTPVTITGAGFAPGVGTTGFKFGKKKASDVECGSSTSCTATTPRGAGAVTVVASVGKLKSSSNPPGDTFTYE
jgi:alpha-tubulin suppressor-like RCC1 family protein